jgi:hypothetical protein
VAFAPGPLLEPGGLAGLRSAERGMRIGHKVEHQKGIDAVEFLVSIGQCTDITLLRSYSGIGRTPAQSGHEVLLEIQRLDIFQIRVSRQREGQDAGTTSRVKDAAVRWHARKIEEWCGRSPAPAPHDGFIAIRTLATKFDDM